MTQSSSQGTCNKATCQAPVADSGIKVAAAASWTLTWGNLVGNWAAARGSSHPGECMPAWLRSALKKVNKDQWMRRVSPSNPNSYTRSLAPFTVSWVLVLLYWHNRNKHLRKFKNKHIFVPLWGDSNDGNKSRWRTNGNKMFTFSATTAPQRPLVVGDRAVVLHCYRKFLWLETRLRTKGVVAKKRNIDEENWQFHTNLRWWPTLPVFI